MNAEHALPAGARVVLVQLCDPRRFLYLAERLLEEHPHWRLEGLVTDHPYLRQGADRLDERMPLHLFRGRLPDLPAGFDRVLVTPAEPGSRRLRETARALSERPWRIDFTGRLFALREGAPELLEESPSPPPDLPPDLLEYEKTFSPPLQGTVLLLECCHPSLPETTTPCWRPLLGPDARTVRLPGDSPLKAWRAARAAQARGALLFTSGEPGFALTRWIPLLFRLPRGYLVDEEANLFALNPRGLVRYFLFHLRRGRLEPRPAPRIVLVESESPRLVAKAPEALRRPGLFPRSEIVLLSLPATVEEYRRRGGFDRIEAFSGGLLSAWKAMRRLDGDLSAAFCTDHPEHRRSRRLFSLLPSRNRLLLNAELQCFRPGIASRLRRLDGGPLLPEETVEERDFRSVLLIQTEGDEEMREAVKRIADPKVVPRGRIRVFCREDRREFFERLPAVERVFSYRKGDPAGSLKTILRLCLARFDVVAAVFSGRPVFRKQKLLFFTMPARSRLVFNRHLDAYYLRPSTLGRLLPSPARRGSPTPLRPLRLILKFALFFPRFFYLVIWLTLQQVRRRYTERR